MKKLLLVGMMLLMMASMTACGKATKKTEVWSYNEETKEMELVETKKEEIDGIFDEEVTIEVY